MKRLVLLFLLAAMCGGCRSTYNITLNNGMVITSKGKPKYDKDKGTFYYTDALGQEQHISMTAVRRIEPQSSKGNQFIN